MNTKPRLMWLDIAKGIAILCTVIGHTVTGRIKGMIYSFHMPLFFLLAGYTFREVPASEMKKAIKKDIVRLLIPYILFGCIKMLTDVFFYHQQIGKTIVVYRFVLLYIKEYRQMFILMLAFAYTWHFYVFMIWIPNLKR